MSNMIVQKKSVGNVIKQHMMTGIGYMIPVITGSTIVMGVLQIIGMVFGMDVTSEVALEAGGMTQMLAWMIQVAAPACRDLMWVVFAGFLSYSIADRTGLVMGLFGGLLSTMSGAGFFGAIITGFASGYIMKFARGKIKVKRAFLPVMNMAVYPILGCTVVFILCYAVVNPLGSTIINGISSLLDTIGSLGGALVSMILAGGAAVDIGGPISKGFLPISFSMAGNGFTIHPIHFGSMAPAIAFGLTVLLDKYVFSKRVGVRAFDDELDAAGLPGLVLGFLGVAEGALPLMLSDPIVMIAINTVGGAMSGGVAYVLGLNMPINMPLGIWSLPICNSPFAYFVGLFSGVIFIVAMTLLRRYALAKKQVSNDVSDVPQTEII